MKLNTKKIISKLSLLEAQLEAIKIECCIAREELERFNALTPPSGKNNKFKDSAARILTNRNASMFKKGCQ